MTDCASASSPKYFKYMNKSTGLTVLKNSTLRWSTPKALNDPHEHAFNARPELNYATLKEKIITTLWKTYKSNNAQDSTHIIVHMMATLASRVPEMSEAEFRRTFADTIDEGLSRGAAHVEHMKPAFDKLLAQNKVLCLSLTGCNTAMWGYYADSFQGIVLKFKCVEGLDSPWPIGKKVRYEDKPPGLINEIDIIGFMTGSHEIDVERKLEEIVFTKSREWSHENEWRISTGAGRNPDAPHEDVRFSPLELDAIYFGYRMTSIEKDTLIEISKKKYPHAEIHEASPSSTGFGVKLSPL